MNNRLIGLGSTFFLCLLAQSQAQAEIAPPPAGDAAANSDEIVIEGKTFAQNNSALGMGASVIETPRTVQRIDATQLKDLSIESVRDFAKVVPGAYTTTQFGGANTPSLRGQTAEIYQDGILRTPRANGLPVSFNGVGGLDVVKGPAGVVYGPTGRVGGYVNFVTKKPQQDGLHVFVDASYGRWDDKRVQADIGGPINEVLGLRLSYERVDSDSYYRLGFMDSHDIYGALQFTPSDKLTIDANIEYYHAKFTENTGINRPTQELIDDGLYYQGTGIGRFSSPTATDRRGFRSVINVTGVTKIDRSFQLVGPDDYAKGSDLVAQLHVNYQLSDQLTIANHMAYEDYTQIQEEYAQRFYNYIPKSHNFQNRLELSGEFGKQKIVIGAAYRAYESLSYADFFNEYLNATDITTDPATYQINNLAGVVAVPGRTNEFATPGTTYGVAGYTNAQAGTADQKANQIGFFAQGMFHLTDELSVLAGARLDRIHERLADPLPPPGATAARDTITEWEKAFNTSVTYAFTPNTSIYATFNYNESPASNVGGYAPFTSGVLIKENFHIDNYLYEGGAKAALIGNKLFGAISIFKQKRSVVDAFGAVSRVVAKGAELQLNYQATKNFSMMASYTYIDAMLPNARQSAFTRDVYDAFAAPYGNGNGSPNFTALTGTFRMPGLPKHMLTGFAKYKSDMGLGGSINGQLTSPMNTSYLGNVKIRTQFQIDGTIFYDVGKFTIYANLYNITNEKNWSAAGGSQGNDLINADLPFHWRLGARFRF
ncbi:TonB-dependent siderophore receptor [Sphingomonas sp.]|uniref:TonB-dependent receptor n=1 Tax=Sphingomonas sp. TaxID=28214 RepID=UPI000DB3DD13|nr:TonB-dependent receptor [Sphingomonas sp.]PZU10218.1 MAG: hypothetical protein DI605_06430 [Sphingomonas sp.]